MISRLSFAAVLLLVISAAAVSEWRKADAPVSPSAVLHFIADTERELTRVPLASTRMPDAKEIAIGNRLMASGGPFPPPNETDDVDMQVYLEQVGGRVSSRAHRKPPYRFHYVADINFVNAFAIPGGHVFVGAGLIDLMDTEDELAAVLGHEIEHIDHYHCAERIQIQSNLETLGPLGAAASVPVAMFTAGYSKGEELEADRDGLVLMVEAGYSPQAAVKLYKKFADIQVETQSSLLRPSQPKTIVGEMSGLARQTFEGYFRSHPEPLERAAEARSAIRRHGWTTARPERALALKYAVVALHARAELESRSYERASQLAAEALRLRPAHPSSLHVLGEAQLSLAHFEQAAAAYASLLEAETPTVSTIQRYAETSVWSNAAQAADKRLAALRGQGGPQPIAEAISIERAGLAFFAGADAEARRLAEAAAASPDADDSPERMARIAWWYYQAGKYEEADRLLALAVMRRPTEVTVQTALGWTRVMRGNFEGALQRFSMQTGATSGPGTKAYDATRDRSGRNTDVLLRMRQDPTLGLAVTRWLAHDYERAIDHFLPSVNSEPAYLTTGLVNAEYGTKIGKIVDAIASNNGIVYVETGHRDRSEARYHRRNCELLAGRPFWAVRINGVGAASGCQVCLPVSAR